MSKGNNAKPVNKINEQQQKCITPESNIYSNIEMYLKDMLKDNKIIVDKNECCRNLVKNLFQLILGKVGDVKECEELKNKLLKEFERTDCRRCTTLETKLEAFKKINNDLGMVKKEASQLISNITNLKIKVDQHRCVVKDFLNKCNEIQSLSTSESGYDSENSNISPTVNNSDANKPLESTSDKKFKPTTSTPIPTQQENTGNKNNNTKENNLAHANQSKDKEIHKGNEASKLIRTEYLYAKIQEVINQPQ